jgi:hypothetical protein
VDAAYQHLYTELDDGTYTLNIAIEGDDLSGLKNNASKLKSEKLKLQAKLDKLEDDERKRNETYLEDKGQYELLIEQKEKTFNDKLTQSEERAIQAESRLKKTILASELDALATNLAGDNSVLIKPHLKSRLIVNEDFSIKVLDQVGNESTMTTEQLLEEFKSSEVFAPILKSRGSSGGGANGGSGRTGTSDQYAKYFDESNAEYSPMKQGDLQLSDPEIYASLNKKYNLDSI